MRLASFGLIGLFLIPPALAQPEWVELRESPYHGYRSEDISFSDPTHGWAVNGDGGVSHTTDGGETWTARPALQGYLRSTAFVSRSVGWIGVLHSDTKLYETRDGGQTFQDITSRIQPAIRGGICSLYAVNEQVVYGAGQFSAPAYFIKTTDGGQTWTSKSLTPWLNTVIDIYFFDENRGLAVGGAGNYGTGEIVPRVIGTEDGGETWTIRRTSTVPNAWGWKLSFPTPEVGYMSIESYTPDLDAYILKTTDGGATWGQIKIPGAGTSRGDMQGIGFLTEDIGWTSGRGTISMTTDGGTSWTTLNESNQLDGNVNRFRFLGNGLAFASGYKIHRLGPPPVASDPQAEDADGLLAVQPNPSASVAEVRYRLAAPARVRIEVVDLLGRTVATVADGPEGAGERSAQWHIPSDQPPGLYFIRMRAGEREWTRQLVVAR